MLIANAAHAACDWNKPGSNPQTGDKIASLDNYTEIPQAVRAALAEKMLKHDFDDRVVIGKNFMRGKQDYHSARDMHWGNNRLCRGEVNRSAWAENKTHGALVYTAFGYSVAVASICGNVFRLDMAGNGGGGEMLVIPEQHTRYPSTENNPETPQPDEGHGGGGAPINYFFSLQHKEENSWVNWGWSYSQNPLVPPAPPLPNIPAVPAPPFGNPPVIHPPITIIHPPIVIPTPPIAPPVPEPETWMMILAGLAVLGLQAKKIK